MFKCARLKIINWAEEKTVQYVHIKPIIVILLEPYSQKSQLVFPKCQLK